jgi:2,5-furandicarboxylate decarboxylase 1
LRPHLCADHAAGVAHDLDVLATENKGVTVRVREFITKLAECHDLAVVDFEVLREQIPLMIKAEEAGRNRAIMFNKIRDHSVSVVANLYGSYARYAMCIGTDERSVWKKIDHAVRNPVKSTTTTNASCFEVVHSDPDITKILPLTQYHSLDAGPYLTSGLLFMKDPMTGRRNISFMRHMIKGPRKIGYNPKSVHNKAYYEKIALANKRMEVAICVGAPTEMIVAGAQRIPDERDEVEVACALADAEGRKELAMAKCQTVDIEVPAETELVFEGIVSTELEPEGPFGDWTGAYARPQMKPSLLITCISHRRDFVYETIMPADSKEQIILTIVRFSPQIEDICSQYPEIRRIAVPEYALGRLAVVAIEKSDRIDEIMRAFLEIQCINRVVIVNKDVDVDSAEDVLWAMSNRILEPDKIIAESCVDEWWNNLKFGIDTTVDIDDIRHKRPTLMPFQGRMS